MVQYETLLHRNSRSLAYEMNHSVLLNKAVSITYYIKKKSTDHALYKLQAIPANISSLMHLKTSAN